MKFNHRIAYMCVTLGPIGYLPAPGTCATLVTMLVFYWLKFANIIYYGQALFIALMTGVALFMTQAIYNYFSSSDPSYVVIDEVVGSLFAIYCLPARSEIYFLAFLLFRLFDIAKPFGIKKVDKLPGAMGIVLDDIMAGILANIILTIALAFL